ncbi:hypothetical protein SAMN05216464_1095 [Mucilaginibacter pineti]|uniref:Lipocalin-like domain-containing protein n=1 Tax=Mucilaginibacter pineti TaxID=1391627 RepID=A0A1G7FD18_9SPHI|nr:hypothetical protein [Mucilaginibacter pineti]SDE73829.1 hypothetical protein SAMN05216464_1095 [Mucilaginibacter pineti]
MNAKLLTAALAAALLTALASCKKDANGPSSKEKYLTTGTWTLQKIEYQTQDGGWVPDPHAADMDHIALSFHTDKSVTAVDGSSSAIDLWEATDDFSQLTVSPKSGGAVTYGVSELTGSTMVLVPAGGYSSYYKGERDTYAH